MKLIGLTGGIGSGKSTVGKLLATHGATVCDVDVIAREVLALHAPALTQVRERFGPDVFEADGALNRQALAAVVFAHPAALKALEQITHPYISTRLAEWLRIQRATLPHLAMVVIDHPLLIETQDLSAFDAVVVVTCDDAVRRERLINQRGLDPGDVTARIAVQTDDATRRLHATHVLDNSGDLAALTAAVATLHAALTAKDMKPLA